MSLDVSAVNTKCVKVLHQADIYDAKLVNIFHTKQARVIQAELQLEDSWDPMCTRIALRTIWPLVLVMGRPTGGVELPRSTSKSSEGSKSVLID